MTQIKYVLMDLKQNKRFFSVQILLVLVTFVLIGFCAAKYLTLSKLKNTADGLLNLDETYIAKDLTDADADIVNADNILKLKELYELICKQDHYRIGYVGDVYISEDIQVSLVEADYNGMELFGLEKEAEILKNAKVGGYTPVIAGYDLKASFNIGDIVLDEYIIAGFFDDGAYYIQPSFTADIAVFNQSLLYCPEAYGCDDPFMLESAITRTCIITNDTACINEIIQRSNDLGLFNIRYISMSDQISRIMKQEMILVYYSLIFIIMASVLGIICMVTSMLVFIEKHARELAIHIMCGASIIDICMRITFQAGAAYIIAFIMSSLLYRNVHVSLLLFIICIVLCAAAAVVPTIKMYRQGIVRLLKRSE